MRVRRHGLIKDRITVVPEDKRSEPSHGCVGGTATTDDNDRVSPDTPEIVDPAHRRLDLSVEATDKVAETVGLEITDYSCNIAEVGNHENGRGR
jgi:hypothetical protein